MGRQGAPAALRLLSGRHDGVDGRSSRLPAEPRETEAWITQQPQFT